MNPVVFFISHHSLFGDTSSCSCNCGYEQLLGEMVLCNFMVRKAVRQCLGHGMEAGILLFRMQVNQIIKNIYCWLPPAGFISDVTGAVPFPHPLSIHAVSIVENHIGESLYRRGWCHSEAVSYEEGTSSACIQWLLSYEESQGTSLSSLAQNWELKSLDR